MTQPSWNNPIWYRGYRIYFEPPPIPIRTMDWQFVHDDYDGGSIEPFGPPADDRAGSCASIEECKQQIDEIEEGKA